MNQLPTQNGELRAMFEYLREDIKDMREELREELKSLREEIQKGSSVLATHTADDHKSFTDISNRLAAIEVAKDTEEKVKETGWTRVAAWVAIIVAAITAGIEAFHR